MNESQENCTEKYTVVVGARPFVLSRSQIEHDSPNYFTSCFFGPANQTINTHLEVPRDPYVFELVLRYLSGYQVVPIHESLVPPTSTRDTALADLRADAQFYRLRGLVEQCAVGQEQNELAVHYAIVTGQLAVTSDWLSPTEDIDNIVRRSSISLLSEELYQIATTADFYQLTKATAQEASYLVVSGWSNQIARGVMNWRAPSVDKWEMVGWKLRMNGVIRHAIIFVKIWARRGDFLK